MFSPKSFIVSGLTCRSLIYFQFIFVYSVRECSNLVLLHVAVQFSKHHLFISSIVYSCLLCHRVGDSSCVDLSLGFYPILFIYISVFLCQYYTVLITVALQCSLKLGKLISPTLFFFLKIALAICGFQCFHTNCDFFFLIL